MLPLPRMETTPDVFASPAQLISGFKLFASRTACCLPDQASTVLLYVASRHLLVIMEAFAAVKKYLGCSPAAISCNFATHYK